MERRRLTPDLPTYEIGQLFLQIVDGVRDSHYKSMREDIYEHIRSPQNPVDWKDPEAWIPQKLAGKSCDLALHFWRKSEHLVNPRHTFGPMDLCTIHELVDLQNDVVRISERGRKFIENELTILAKIDQHEGLLLVLSEVAAKGPEVREQFYEEYKHFCRTRTDTIRENTIRSSLSLRLSNLVQRNLIKRLGVSYEITDAGICYLERLKIQFGTQTPAGAAQVGHPKRIRSEFDPDLANLIREKNWRARQQLLEFLQSMDPVMLEHLIKFLLEKMGYEDVQVTSLVNDKGVDVVGDIEVGISRVREVIQVKRQKDSVKRPTLDQLRGSLYRFDAIRGTIITTGKFSKGANDEAFAVGAAPITLIDGQALINLLVKHNIGIRRRELRFLEFDESSLKQFEPEDKLESLPSGE